jgi:hypothetical protein
MNSPLKKKISPTKGSMNSPNKKKVNDENISP